VRLGGQGSIGIRFSLTIPPDGPEEGAADNNEDTRRHPDSQHKQVILLLRDDSFRIHEGLTRLEVATGEEQWKQNKRYSRIGD